METPITLDQPRSLRFDYSACKKLEIALNGAAIGEIVAQLQRCSLNALETVIYLGLLHAEPTINRSLVGKRIKSYLNAGGRVSDLVTSCIKALNDSEVFANEDDDSADAEGNAKPEQAEA